MMTTSFYLETFLPGCNTLSATGCLVIILFQTITCQADCQNVNSISGYSLTTHTYRRLPGVRLITCIVRCEDDPECYSLNFKFSFQECELNNETRLSIEPKYFVPTENTVYLDNLYRPYKPCDNEPCKNNGSCVIMNSYPGFRCDCKDGYLKPTCEKCSSYQQLGMTSEKIKNKQITASSHAPGYPAYKGRLGGSSCWRSANNTFGEFLEINFGQRRYINGIATQGDPQADNWTQQLYLAYFAESIWRNVTIPYQGVRIFRGNKDRKSSIIHLFSIYGFFATAIRFHPLQWQGNIALRVEVYGC